MTRKVPNAIQGRPKGSLNRTTIEKQRIAAEIAARTVVDAKSSHRKLAKEHMQDFIPILAGMAAHYQPTYPGMPVQNPHGHEGQFERWLLHFLAIARALAPFESATFRAIDLRATLPTGSETNPLEIMRTMLDEIDDESRAERTQARQIEYVEPADDAPMIDVPAKEVA